MPISRRAYEAGELDPEVLIIDFLRSDPDQAYEIKELIAELASNGIRISRTKMLGILSGLQQRGRIEAKKISGVVYYICSRRIGFKT